MSENISPEELEYIKKQKAKKGPIDDEPSIEEEGGEELWLLSYADMMTLIACFFIMLVAFATFEPIGFSEKTQKLSEHFGGPKIKDSQNHIDQLDQELALKPKIQEITRVKKTENFLELTFKGSALFDTGKADLIEETLPILDSVIDIILETNPGFQVVVEGHTDSRPIYSTRFRSNWELSGSRASSVVERMQEMGFNGKNVVAVGYGASRLLAPDVNEKDEPLFENMQNNRRVVLKILEPAESTKKSIKLGLGQLLQHDKNVDLPKIENNTENQIQE